MRGYDSLRPALNESALAAVSKSFERFPAGLGKNRQFAGSDLPHWLASIESYSWRRRFPNPRTSFQG